MNAICISTSVPNVLYDPFKVLPHYTVPKYWIKGEEGTGRLAQFKKYYCKWYYYVQCVLYSVLRIILLVMLFSFLFSLMA